jgi:hypothetical protein
MPNVVNHQYPTFSDIDNDSRNPSGDSSRNATDRRSDRCIPCWTRQRPLNTGEEIDHLSRFKHTVALPSDVALAQHARGLEAIYSFAGSHL